MRFQSCTFIFGFLAEKYVLVSKRVTCVLFCYVCPGLSFLRWLIIIT